MTETRDKVAEAIREIDTEMDGVSREHGGQDGTKPIWPAGCDHPNSCSRHGHCMYIGCVHEGAKITPSNKEAGQ